MPRHFAILLTVVAFALLALACNGGPATTTPTGGRTATVRPSGTAGGQFSPAGSTTPTGGGTATSQPTQTTAAPQAAGTPAVAPADLSRYEGQTITQEDCRFDPRSSSAICSRGTYNLIPTFTGEDISCSVLIVQDKPVVVGCSSQAPLQTVYYAIEG